MVDPPDICGFPHSKLTPKTKNPIKVGKSYGNNYENSTLYYTNEIQHCVKQKRNTFSLSNLLFCLLSVFILFGQVSGHALPSSQTDPNSYENSIKSRSSIPSSSNPTFIKSYDPSSRDNNAVSLEDWSSLTNQSDKNGFLNIFSHDPVDGSAGITPSFTLPSVQYFKRQASEAAHTCACGHEISEGEKIGFGIVVPILVLLSGVFAGLTLGYMSLDETQLQVLMTTGDEIQRERAKKIMPIRKDGHLLLTTLLIANMITNETLPVIFDPLLPSGVVSVVISTVLIVIFSELIPQSTCSRYGLQIGAVMAFPTRIIIIIFWPIAFPVSRILHWTLGPHHGIVYRRAELKELVTMHAASGGRGGDLNRDTVMIVGGALDLQEKVVKQAMTPIDKVFMLPFTAKLDYPTLERVVRSGHSRIPIYQEVEVSVSQSRSGANTPRKKLNLLSPFTRKSTVDESTDNKEGSGTDGDQAGKTMIKKKIIGTLLVKACVLLDPEDATPVSSMIINALPTVPGDEPLLNVLNVFQEGRSHMAIVSPRPRRGMNESTSDFGSKSHLYHSSHGPGGLVSASAAPRVDGLGNIDEEKHIDGAQNSTSRSSNSSASDSASTDETKSLSRHQKGKGWRSRFGLRSGEKDLMEQSVPGDATVDEKQVQQKMIELNLTKVDSRVSFAHEEGSDQPIGIITLEDVLEELLCEEILDEYDDRGNEEEDFRTYIPPPSPDKPFKVDGQKQSDAVGILDGEIEKKPMEDKVKNDLERKQSTNVVISTPPVTPGVAPPPRKTVLGRLGLNRQKSTKTGEEELSGAPIVVDNGNRKNTENEAVVTTPMESVRKVVSRGGDSEDNYFSSAMISTANQPIRSMSLPPESESNARQDNAMADHSLLPAAAITDDKGKISSVDSAITSAFGGGQIVTTPPPLSPNTSKPVLVRAQMPGGPQKTVLASESLLRGRQMRPSQTLASGMGAGTGEIGTQNQVGNVIIGGGMMTPSAVSRSGTPVGGNRGNRFKSQAATGLSGTLSGSVIAAQQQQQQQQQQRTRSLGTAISTIAPQSVSQPTTRPPTPTLPTTEEPQDLNQPHSSTEDDQNVQK